MSISCSYLCILIRVCQCADLLHHTCALQKHCHTKDDIENLRDWMAKELHVVVNSKKRQSKNVDSTQISKKKESFIGEECLKLMRQWDRLLDHVYDDLLSGKYEVDKQEAIRAWETWQDLWDELRTNLPGEDGKKTSPPSKEDRLNKSIVVQDLAAKFLGAFVRLAGGSDDATFYVHVATKHLPDFVKMYGNLMFYSAQGAEHLHHFTKEVAKGASSKQPGYRMRENFEGSERALHFHSMYPNPRRRRTGASRN